MMKIEGVEFECGAVTFLDVLGWKGIWRENANAIKELHGIIEATKNFAGTKLADYDDDVREERGQTLETTVLSVSDTIALFTSGVPDKAIAMHARICSWLLPYALERHIPLRGAISYGRYLIQENIMLGYAVDEAASWHESTDWIGVILTPSAQMKLQRETKDGIGSVQRYDSIPFKKAERNLKYCVQWEYPDTDKLHEIIHEKGPHTPDIAPKYLNTLAFLDSTKEIEAE